MNKILSLLLIVIIAATPLLADDAYEQLLPEEYNEDEFHPFLRDLRRAEVILVGSYPFSIFFTKIGMDMFDYASSGFDRAKAPAIFGGTAREARTSDETAKLLLSALYVSIGITVADFIIGKIKDKKANADK